MHRGSRVRINEKFHGFPEYWGKVGTVIATKVSLEMFGVGTFKIITVLLEDGTEVQGTPEKFDEVTEEP